MLIGKQFGPFETFKALFKTVFLSLSAAVLWDQVSLRGEGCPVLCSVGSSILGLCPLDASSAARSRAERGFHAFNKSQKKRKTTETVYVTNKARTFTEGFLVPSLRVVLLTFETNSSVRKVFFQCRQQLRTQGLKLMMVCLPLNSPTLGNFLNSELRFPFL